VLHRIVGALRRGMPHDEPIVSDGRLCATSRDAG
jgi:hypothetical protein